MDWRLNHLYFWSVQNPPLCWPLMIPCYWGVQWSIEVGGRGLLTLWASATKIICWSNLKDIAKWHQSCLEVIVGQRRYKTGKQTDCLCFLAKTFYIVGMCFSDHFECADPSWQNCCIPRPLLPSAYKDFVLSHFYLSSPCIRVQYPGGLYTPEHFCCWCFSRSLERHCWRLKYRLSLSDIWRIQSPGIWLNARRTIECIISSRITEAIRDSIFVKVKNDFPFHAIVPTHGRTCVPRTIDTVLHPRHNLNDCRPVSVTAEGFLF